MQLSLSLSPSHVPHIDPSHNLVTEVFRKSVLSSLAAPIIGEDESSFSVEDEPLR